jgi:predicted nucleic acid-binding protein
VILVEVSGELTLRLAATLSLSACDAQYVALAETLDTALLTEDRGLLDKAPRRALSLARHLAD